MPREDFIYRFLSDLQPDECFCFVPDEQLYKVVHWYTGAMDIEGVGGFGDKETFTVPSRIPIFQKMNC